MRANGSSAHSRALIAVLAVLLFVLPGSAAAADYSGTCTSPNTTAADVYVGPSGFVRLRAQSNPSDPNTTWICFRIANGPSTSIGGRLDVSGGAVAPGTPSVDANSSACTSTGGNMLPPPHPMVAGFVGPLTLVVDAYVGSGQAALCVEAGDVKRRVAVPVPGIAVPSGTLFLDSGAPLPAPGTGPLGYPSSSCQAGLVGTPTQHLNASIGNAHVWLYSAQPSSSKVHVCARLSGPVAAGGMLTVDTTGSPGVAPVVQTSTTDISPCTVPLAGTTSPVVTLIAISPPGATPASVCVVAGSEKRRVTVGVTGSPVLPSATWSKDPDSVG